MKRWGKVIPAVAVGCAMLAVAGCGPEEIRDVVVGGGELSALLKGVPDIRIPASDIRNYADSTSVGAGTWRDTAQSIGDTHPWETITGRLESIDLAMGKTTREVALKTACDMLVQKLDGQKVTPELDLIINIPTKPSPPFQETLEAANNAYTVLASDQADGDKTDEAAVSVTCYIANKEYDLLAH